MVDGRNRLCGGRACAPNSFGHRERPLISRPVFGLESGWDPIPAQILLLAAAAAGTSRARKRALVFLVVVVVVAAGIAVPLSALPTAYLAPWCCALERCCRCLVNECWHLPLSLSPCLLPGGREQRRF